MPSTINGLGTSLHGYGAAVRWTDPASPSFSRRRRGDHDAVVCICLLFLPVLPLRAIHAFDWSGNAYTQVRIRMTLSLFLRAMLMPWFVVALVLSGMALLQTELMKADAPLAAHEGTLALITAGVVPVALAGLWLMSIPNRRHRDIRLILGRHALGSSDPALWQPEVEQSLRGCFPPIALDCRPSDVLEKLESGRPVEAMWLARLARARGEPWAEAVTAEILSHPEVSAKLKVLRKQPWKWEELFEQECPGWWPPGKPLVARVNAGSSS